MSDSLDPLRLLQEDLKDDDYEQSMQSINRLTTIAIALGPARTRNELIPFLLEYADQDNDEAHASVGRQLGDFVPLVGGPAHAVILLPLLEKLASEEECVVRDAAVGSITKLTGHLSKQEVVAKVVPMLRRLANGDWFTTRVSACGMFASTYVQLTDATIQGELRSLFNNMCNDDTPMVRKAAYKQLGDFSIVVPKQFFKSDMLPILKAISTDDIDSMRIFAIDCCCTVAPKLEAGEFVTSVLPIVEAIQDDSSWRVRQQLCLQFSKIATGVGDQVASHKLLPLYANLLKDKEAEVRSSAATQMAEVCRVARSGILDHIAPVLDGLSKDPVQNVRVSFSKTLLQLCPLVPQEQGAKLFLPVVLQLTKDELHTVRNNIIEEIDVLSELLGPAFQSNLLPQLLELSKDPKWRVRMAVVSKSALLARSLGQKTFEKKIQPILLGSLQDHVYAIRECACAQIGEIVAEYGGKWASEKLFPNAFTIYDKQTNYLHRMTCLLLVQRAAREEKCGNEAVVASLLPIVIQACTDDVPNVRIAASRAMVEVIGRCDPTTIQQKIKPLLQKMIRDTDGDVQHFATVTLKLCPN